MRKSDLTSEDASGWGSALGGRITPQDVQQKEFRVARFGAGYRMREVDEFLDQVTDAMSALVAENERLLQGSASESQVSSRPSTLLPADDAGRGAVDAFLRREKGFLQDLGGLVQSHAEELRSMVRGVRRDVVAPAAAAPTVEEASVEPALASVSEPSSDTSEAEEPPGEVSAEAEVIGGTEQMTPSADAPDDEMQGDDPEDPGGQPTASTGVVAEPPIRLDEPEPARSGRSDEEEEGSLRELFWGEE
jgi:DivIVA domain-containing protein